SGTYESGIRQTRLRPLLYALAGDTATPTSTAARSIPCRAKLQPDIRRWRRCRGLPLRAHAPDDSEPPETGGCIVRLRGGRSRLPWVVAGVGAGYPGYGAAKPKAGQVSDSNRRPYRTPPGHLPAVPACRTTVQGRHRHEPTPDRVG